MNILPPPRIFPRKFYVDLFVYFDFFYISEIPAETNRFFYYTYF